MEYNGKGSGMDETLVHGLQKGIALTSMVMLGSVLGGDTLDWRQSMIPGIYKELKESKWFFDCFLAKAFRERHVDIGNRFGEG